MSLSISRQLAVMGGVALPLIETARRWHHLADLSMLPFWLDGWLIGTFLLYGAWRTRPDATGGVPVLAAAWGVACAFGYSSFFSQLAQLDTADPSGIATSIVVPFKAGLMFSGLVALVMTLKIRSWQEALPVLVGPRVTLREIELRDAGSLLAVLTPETAHHNPPPPVDLPAMEAFVAMSRRQRREGRGACFVVVPLGQTAAIGLLQFFRRPVSGRGWGWGFILGSTHWGQGLFREAAGLALRFAFDEIRPPELEAWVVEANARANRAMTGIGAQPTPMRATRVPDGRTGDFIRWTITPIPR